MADEDKEGVRVPIVEETVTLSKREVKTGHVRVRTIVEEHIENVVADLSRERIGITRRPVERQVDAAPVPYDEDGAWIVPVVEERLVVEKRLYVVEEIVMRRSRTSDAVEIPTAVRSMRAVIESDDDPESQRD